MSLEFLKILAQPVALERDEDGNITGERVGEAMALYTPEQFEQYANEIRAQIESMEEEVAAPEENGAPPARAVPKTRRVKTRR